MSAASTSAAWPPVPVRERRRPRAAVHSAGRPDPSCSQPTGGSHECLHLPAHVSRLQAARTHRHHTIAPARRTQHPLLRPAAHPASPPAGPAARAGPGSAPPGGSASRRTCAARAARREGEVLSVRRAATFVRMAACGRQPACSSALHAALRIVSTAGAACASAPRACPPRLAGVQKAPAAAAAAPVWAGVGWGEGYAGGGFKNCQQGTHAQRSGRARRRHAGACVSRQPPTCVTGDQRSLPPSRTCVCVLPSSQTARRTDSSGGPGVQRGATAAPAAPPCSGSGCSACCDDGPCCGCCGGWPGCGRSAKCSVTCGGQQQVGALGRPRHAMQAARSPIARRAAPHAAAMRAHACAAAPCARPPPARLPPPHTCALPAPSSAAASRLTSDARLLARSIARPPPSANAIASPCACAGGREVKVGVGVWMLGTWAGAGARRAARAARMGGGNTMQRVSSSARGAR